MVKNIISKILGKFNLTIINQDLVVKIDNERKNYRHKSQKLQYIFLNDRIKNPYKVYELSKESTSQVFQDLFVLNETNFKQHGYFIEIGAADGKYFSNSYLLEKKYGWQGLLVEPARIWHKELKENRNCQISTDCIFDKSGIEVEFIETKKPSYSQIRKNSNIFEDTHINLRKNINKKYYLKTKTLNDLFAEYSVPNNIDYISIDTEGTEYEILKGVDFKKYNIHIISVEHNNAKKREKIFNLLTTNNYLRVQTEFSQFDDWYILNS